eukprot:CAMPEP_0178915406 /NCGR_PEP_ID=MMETSP0786-20121207/12011_1 /TAXON_ID=186022 /ORGANISM="Thalassionema frauenfeldii, Strain CCMP 1798" /LENGTH=277 /DNA_ID=CAMNT_0020588517 /DNA_START=59 /DNA_END=888 /DNA_ORIENTATION=+
MILSKSFALFQGFTGIMVGNVCARSFRGPSYHSHRQLASEIEQECGVPGVDPTPCTKRPTQIDMRYIGQTCDQSVNVQEPRVWICQQFRTPSPIALVVARDIRTGSIFYFNGILGLGDHYVLQDNGREVVANMNVTIYSPPIVEPGNIIQTMVFHTSCSQDLNFGDTFGSHQVIGWNSTKQNIIQCTNEPSSSPSDVVFTATVSPSKSPTVLHSEIPSGAPSFDPSEAPSVSSSSVPSTSPSTIPTSSPSTSPSSNPSASPSDSPSEPPSPSPSSAP